MNDSWVKSLREHPQVDEVRTVKVPAYFINAYIIKLICVPEKACNAIKLCVHLTIFTTF